MDRFTVKPRLSQLPVSLQTRERIEPTEKRAGIHDIDGARFADAEARAARTCSFFNAARSWSSLRVSCR
jgi:hypothetical protein